MPTPPRTMIVPLLIAAALWGADAKKWDRSTVQDNHPNGPHGIRTGGSHKHRLAKRFARTNGRRMRAGR